MDKFVLKSNYKPMGDQPQAIDSLANGVLDGDKEQVLLGVTGSGKTFTMANIIEKVNRPTLILALIHLFSDNTETIVAGRRALRIICIGFAVSGVSVVTAGALEAMGKGIHSLLISCMRYIVLILPLAFIFSHFFGVNGVWHAFWITEVITAVTSGLIFYRQYRAIA